jgi:hypothetical protein
MGSAINPAAGLYNLIRGLALRQESRPYHFNNFLIFCVFTGLVRGLQEALFFGHNLRNSFLLSIIPFYLSMGMMLVLVLTSVLKVSWQRATNAVCIGIFIGLFPPMIDLVLHDGVRQLYYSYYYYWSIDSIPWLWYDPKLNFHAGETFGLWACILFSAVYAWIKSGNAARTLIVAVLAYGVVFYHAVFLMTVVTRLHVGEIVSPGAVGSYQNYRLKFVSNNLIFWQGLTAWCCYILFRPALARQLLKRMPHILPFVLISVIGSSYTSGVVNGQTLYTSLLVLVLMTAVAVHNDYHDNKYRKGTGNKDRKDSREQAASNTPVLKHDLPALNSFFVICSFGLFFNNSPSVIPVWVFFALSILYHYPHYRAKKHFLTGLKIEGAWGASAFLAGALNAPRQLVSYNILFVAFLLFGGWSLVAAIKDFKDILQDHHDGHLTVYSWLKGRGYSLKKIHRALILLVLLCFLVPVLVLLLHGHTFAGGVLWLPWCLLAWSTTLPRSSKWFKSVLTSMNLYFLVLLYLSTEMNSIIQ